MARVINKKRPVKRKAKTTLSVCMIVRDEEKQLRRCLDSVMRVKDFCDQLIIVDTGSEDSTPDIAREFGAELYFHPWKNSFSEARNKSFSYATCDWVMYIDADEELVGEAQDFRMLKRDLGKKVKTNAVSLRMIDIIKDKPPMNTAAMRIFRRGKVHFENIVHNKPVVEGGNATTQYVGKLHLKHYGYDLAPEEMQAKYRRTVGLLKKRLEVDPDDIQAYFYLAQIYGFYNDEENCMKCCEIYVRECKERSIPNEDFNQSVYALYVNLLVKRKEKEKAKAILDVAMALLPHDLDIAYAQLQYGLTFDDHLQIMIGVFRFISNYETFNSEDSIRERGSRFIFTYTQEHVGKVLYYGSWFFLKCGMNSLEAFDNVLTQTDSLQEEEQSLKESLLNIGINWTRKSIQTKEK